MLADGVLVLVEATQEPDTVQRENGYGIKNFIRDQIQTGTTQTVYEAITTAALTRLNRYALGSGSCALMHVTNFDGDSLIVADVWMTQANAAEAATWKKELDAAEASLSGNLMAPDEPAKKR